MKSVVYLIVFFLSTLHAHQTGLSYLQIQENTDQSIAVIYKKPLEDVNAQDITLRFPQTCQQTAKSDMSVENGFIIEKYPLWCGASGLMNQRIWIEGLVATDKGMLIRYEKDTHIKKALLRASTPFVVLNLESSKFQVFSDYLKLGVVHILEGIDHLLFVLSLMLLISRLKVLLYAITAFTLSHSITLAFGILGLVSVPATYVEAMIALSIVFLARELAIGTSHSFTKEHLPSLAFIFGLLHGFGFSYVLSSIGLPQEEIPLALFSFNVGIELGQLFFIALMGILFYFINKLLYAKRENFYKLLSYAIGSVATFWLIERTVAF
ncbi:MAG: HupE/UreJ family protein [Campylobacterota bacterium]|nr:HupE/UreJ family protein [Campylobacterota bacterium]